MKEYVRVGILGGGPSGLFMFKRLVDLGRTKLKIIIFERKTALGQGMPYSAEGANDEHITNVSGNEIPVLVTTIAEWVKTAPQQLLDRYNIDPENFNDYKVLPRLLFGKYLQAQFDLLLQQAERAGIHTQVLFESEVTDITDHPDDDCVRVEINGRQRFDLDRVIICTGHNWPRKNEGVVPGYFDSPYPPAKLKLQLNHAIALRGSSLTAVDAIRTLARCNGSFKKAADGTFAYHLSAESAGFNLVIHTRNGLLPAVRFHLSDSHLQNDRLLTEAEIAAHIRGNNGFLALDYIFEKDFKEIFRDKEPEFYERIKLMSVEEFVAAMMDLREHLDPFTLLLAEYAEAEKSIQRKRSVYWKEMLGVLSFAMNYPAKHFSAEDMLRLQKALLPLISIVIAYIPQSSAQQLIALHRAGVLTIVPVGDDSHVEACPEGGATYHYTDDDGQLRSTHFETYIDCIGQPHLSYHHLPFKSLMKTTSPARLKFRSSAEGQAAMQTKPEMVMQDTGGNYFLTVPGVAINDSFQILDQYGAYNPRIYMMAVPYIGGLNPDYSGLDFSEEASGAIIAAMFNNERTIE